MKKDILIVVHTMANGGVQQSLLVFLDSIDYGKYNVELLIIKNVNALAEHINPHVRVRVCDNIPNFEYSFSCLALYLLEKICGFLKLGTLARRLHTASMRLHKAKLIRYVYKHLGEKGRVYHTALAYYYEYAAQYVSKYVKARAKVVFYHSSHDMFPQLHKRLLPGYKLIVAGSPAMAEAVKKTHPSQAEKILVLQYYIDADKTRRKAQLTTPAYARGDCAVICSCGRLSPEKGYDLAVEAAHILKKSGVDFIWLHAGDGPERERIEELIEKYSLQGTFILLGMLDNPFGYIAGSDIFVQPSRDDGNPLSVVEAKILCVPVVATKTLGGCFLVDNGINGLTVDIEPKSIARGVSALIGDRELLGRMKDNLAKTDYDGVYSAYKATAEQILDC